MMSSATTSLPAMLLGASPAVAAGETPVSDVGDFTTALSTASAGQSAAAAALVALAAPAALAVWRDTPVVAGDAATSDAEAAALMASMLPMMATPAEAPPEASWPAFPAADADADAKESTDAAIAAVGAMSAIVPTVLPATVTPPAAQLNKQDAPAAKTPANATVLAAAAQAAANNAVPVPAAEVASASETPDTTAPVAVAVAVAVSGSDTAAAKRSADARPTTPLRQLLQAMTSVGEAADTAQSAPVADASPPDFASLVTARSEVAVPVATGTLPQAAAAPPETNDSQQSASAGTASLQAAGPTTPVPGAHGGQSVQMAVHSAVGSPHWAQDLGNQLVLMNTRGQHEGSLILNPEHLGPVEVRISVSQNTANVWFGAQHAETRAALTEAMPRLRELFSEAGLAMGQSGVSHEAPRQRPQAEPGSSTGPGIEGIGAREPLPAAVHRLSRGLVDTYA
jgi:flagellar hook-length control protein FliK